MFDFGNFGRTLPDAKFPSNKNYPEFIHLMNMIHKWPTGLVVYDQEEVYFLEQTLSPSSTSCADFLVKCSFGLIFYHPPDVVRSEMNAIKVWSPIKARVSMNICLKYFRCIFKDFKSSKWVTSTQRAWSSTMDRKQPKLASLATKVPSKCFPLWLAVLIG